MFDFLRSIFLRRGKQNSAVSVSSTLSAEQWLYQYASKPEHIELGLERCQEVLGRLNLSQSSYSVMTVAGTNGKGSTVQFLDSLLGHDKHRSVGRFTSPHLLRFNERIVIDGHEVSDTQLLSAFKAISKAANNIHLTYFEYATIAALYLFSMAKVDVAVLEVGLGGRLDASNAVDADVAVITNIALDHQDWLGSDLELIAREKAGIMRSGKPVILAENDMPQTLRQVALEKSADVYQLGCQYQITEFENGFRWESLESQSRKEFFVDTQSGLDVFQHRNLGAAIAALVCADFEVTQESIAHAVAQGAPQGRMQVLESRGKTWLLDVAHNSASMQVLCEHLLKLQKKSKQKFSVVFGMLKDKDVKTCVELLSPFIDSWYVAPLDSPRTLLNSDLADLFAGQSVEVCASISQACEEVVKNCPSNPILVCGSFYTVADALKYLD